VLLAAFFVTGLAGCASDDAVLSSEAETAEDTQIVYYDRPSGQDPLIMDRYFESQGYPEEKPLTPFSYEDNNEIDPAELVNNGDVEIYALEESGRASSAASGPGFVPKAGYGVTLPENPDVTIYPLDDEFPGEGRQKSIPPSRRDTGAQFPEPEMPAERERPYFAMDDKAEQNGVKKDGRIINSIYFGHDSSSIEPHERRILTAVARDVRNMDIPLAVEGHASKVAEPRDPKLKDIINLRVSMERAYAVASELIRQGIPIERIKACAYGDAREPDFTGDRSEAEASRRVEIRSGN
jgi:outer membrane protein OmpA-like peptidoglycan-associated protein